MHLRNLPVALLAGALMGCPSAAPDAIEIVPVECFFDGDGDGFGWAGTVLDPDGDCTDDPNQSDVGTDCDDAEPTLFPGGEEIPDDGLDQDCNGTDTVSCFTDADLDGFGGDQPELDDDGNCTDPGQTTLAEDCDDEDEDIFPGAEDTADDGIDQDCNGVDATVCYYDGDGDGYGWPNPMNDVLGDCEGPNESSIGTDCDDSSDSIHPGAEEIPDDGYDQDCSGADSVTCYVDADGDGSGGAVDTIDPDGSCTDAGQSPYSGDCDDDDDTVSPQLNEVLDDGIDQDCSGTDAITCYYDGDGDGYGWPGVLPSIDDDCDDPYESSVNTDCDDALDSIHPGAEEVLGDGIDQDCDGVPE